MIRGVIYKYTSPSGKIYIGQTINESSRRQVFFNLNKDYAGPKINMARAKYGPNNFEYQVIFAVESTVREEVIEILDIKEVQYIALYDSFNNGYNSNEGGKGGTHVITDTTRDKLSKSAKEYYETHKSAVAKAVLQYNLAGVFIQEWESAKQAGEALDIVPGAITNVCKGTRKVAGDFIWRYKSDYEVIPERLSNINFKSSSVPLKQYTLDGKFIQEWESITAAAKELSYSLGNFSTYCNGRNNHEYKGFLYYRGDISLYKTEVTNA